VRFIIHDSGFRIGLRWELCFERVVRESCDRGLQAVVRIVEAASLPLSGQPTVSRFLEDVGKVVLLRRQQSGRDAASTMRRTSFADGCQINGDCPHLTRGVLTGWWRA